MPRDRDVGFVDVFAEELHRVMPTFIGTTTVQELLVNKASARSSKA